MSDLCIHGEYPEYCNVCEGRTLVLDALPSTRATIQPRGVGGRELGSSSPDLPPKGEGEDSKGSTAPVVSHSHESPTALSLAYSGSDVLAAAAKPDDRNWPVPGMFSPGLTLLFAAPKAGKTRLLVDVAWNVASGNHCLGDVMTHEGDVLLVLSETTVNALAEIWRDYWPEEVPPSGLTVFPLEAWHEFTSQPDARLGRLMDEWYEASGRPSMVVIDNLTNCVLSRQKVNANERAQTMDYKALKAFHSWANNRDVALVVIHHTNQMRLEKGDDWTYLAAGTGGITAVPDELMLLREDHDSGEVSLRSKGRNLGRQSWDLVWRGGRLLMFSPVELNGRHGSKMRQVYESLKRTDVNRPGVGTPQQVEQLTGISAATASVYLSRLVDKGYVTRLDRGVYEMVVRGDKPS